MLATAEDSNGRFELIFLQNVFFICMKAANFFLGYFLWILPPKNDVFSAGSLLSVLWFKCQDCGSDRLCSLLSELWFKCQDCGSDRKYSMLGFGP